MFKKYKLKFSKKAILTSGLFALAIVPASIGLSSNLITTTNSNDISLVTSNVNSVIKNTSSLQAFSIDTSTSASGYSLYRLLDSDGNETGIAIKVPNFSDTENEDAQTNANSILSLYESLPSNIDTSSDSIWNLIEIDSSKWSTSSSGDTAPKIFNLGKTATYSNNYLNDSSGGTPTTFDNYGITSSTNLPAFSLISTSDSTIQVSETFLDTNGILALQISVMPLGSTNTNIWQSFYIMLTGFGGTLSPNALSNNPILDSNLYANGLSNVSNDDLVNFLANSWSTTITTDEYIASNIPTIAIDNRTDYGTLGELSFSASFSFSILDDWNLSFATGFAGITDNDTSSLSPTPGQSVSIATTNTYESDTSYDLNFNLTGFQPDPAISNTDVIIIVVAVIASMVVVCILGYIVTKVSKTIRFKNAM